MKKNQYFLATVMAAFLLLCNACNDSFMERYPTDSINDGSFWKSTKDLEIYCNGLYTFIVGHSSGQTQSPMLIGDNQSDNMAMPTYNRIAAGEHTVPASGDNWTWAFVRRCNYFLVRYDRVEANRDAKDAFAGEVKFFKAWDYFNKVKLYGDVPWLNRDLNVDSEELFKPRDPRALVMDSVLVTINWAIDKLPEAANAVTGRINKDVALALKARICLHEGTFRKYHGIAGHEKFLREAVDAADKLIATGRYQIHNTGNPELDYRSLFSTLDLKNNKEMIYYKAYEIGLLGNRTSNFVEGGEASLGLCVTKSLVDAYLCKSGKPISLAEDFPGHDSIQAEMLNRDPRLTQTVCYPGKDLQRLTGKPAIPGSDLSTGIIPTGYQIIKYWVDDREEYLRYQNGILDAPVFRYAETLLIKAEAMAELGTCTQEVLDQTVNLLRKRVDMPDMQITSLVKDPLSDFPGLPVLIDEIRRERRVEFAVENMRYDDLIRWKAGKLLEKEVRGMKFVQSQYPTAVVGNNLYVDEENFILPYKDVLPNGRTFEENKHYYFPLPTEELILNPNLEQNPNW